MFTHLIDFWVIRYEIVNYLCFEIRWVDLCKQLFRDFVWQVKFWDTSFGGLIDGAKVTSTKINGDDSNGAGVGVA
jgi:hypothetical protein